jgi:hypothetical protein
MAAAQQVAPPMTMRLKRAHPHCSKTFFKLLSPCAEVEASIGRTDYQREISWCSRPALACSALVRTA